MESTHGGNIWKLSESLGIPASEILDFSANINPLGPPAWLRPVISRNVEFLNHYPDPDALGLVQAVARHCGVPENAVLVGNGSTEILHAVLPAVSVERAVIPVPCYTDYVKSARLAGVPVVTTPMPASADFAIDWPALEALLRGNEAVLIGQPNNPTGRLFDGADFRRVATQHPATVFVVDEAFADFVTGYESLMAARLPNVLILRSMTKFFAIPGLRLGYAVAGARLAESVRRRLPPWSVNTLAQAVGTAALQDAEYAHESRCAVDRLRTALTAELTAFPGLKVYPGVANYLLIELVRKDLRASTLAEKLYEKRIAIRVCRDYEGLGDQFFRIAVRTAAENAILCGALASLLSPRRNRGPKAPEAQSLTKQASRAVTLMIQGTSSSAGKSLMVTALCRILLQDGYRVAPFKAQNMALNSFVTRDGGEMGRAQVVQAHACRVEPDVRMNPILLKPTSDTGSQVIVMGHPVGNMRVHAYTQYKPKAFEIVKEAFDSLAAQYDVIVLEGAGSPAEVNLKQHDIVNMRMADYARSPVLLVGDIDRGGVFASLVGTMEVMEPWERALIAGFIVNRFRGDASLLGPAFDYVQRFTGRPVLGVVPYMPGLNLPQEDSVEFKNGALDSARRDGGAVTVAVIDLPHISNFTDFDALRIEPDVDLHIVRSTSDWARADAIVLPGSKNVLADLDFLRKNGMAERILKAAEEGTEIVGLCGGFQMLGKQIADPYRIESSLSSVAGLGLLDVTTVLEQEKTLTRAEGIHAGSGLPVAGYEIHHGQTRGDGLPVAVTGKDGRPLGVGSPDGRVWGTYLHGLFDADAFRRWFIDRLRSRRGLPPMGRICAQYDLEPALDRLAGIVRESLTMPDIYRIAGLPRKE